MPENSGPSTEPVKSMLLRVPPIKVTEPPRSLPGILLTTFTAPANVLRPKYADCGPLRISIRAGSVTTATADGEATGAPSMKVAVRVDNVVDGTKPRSVICWKERSLRPELILLIVMPGVLSASWLKDTMPFAEMASLEIAVIAIGVSRMLSSRLRAVTTTSSMSDAELVL